MFRRFIYFSEDLHVKLRSLAQVQRCGGSYHTVGKNNLVVVDNNGVIIDISTMGSNGLYPVSAGATVAPLSSAFPAVVPTPTSISVDHISAARRERANRAQVLHCGQAVHSSDDVLKRTLDYGGFPDSNLTSADVTLNRQLRGPCVQCSLAKIVNKEMPPSDSPPPTSVGAKIHLDMCIGERVHQSVENKQQFDRSMRCLVILGL